MLDLPIFISQELDPMEDPEFKNYFDTWFENRNGFVTGMKSIELTVSTFDKVFVSFVGRSGTALRGGFAIKRDDFTQMCKKYLEKIEELEKQGAI